MLHARVQSADGKAKCTLDSTFNGASRDHHSDIGGPECVLVNSAGVFSLASGAHFLKFRNGQVSSLLGPTERWACLRITGGIPITHTMHVCCLRTYIVPFDREISNFSVENHIPLGHISPKEQRTSDIITTSNGNIGML